MLMARDRRSKRTVHMHFVTQGGNGQPRTIVIRANSILTAMNVVDRYPEGFAINIHDVERELGETVPS